MRKFILTLAWFALFCCGSLNLQAAPEKSSYQVMVLGDLHFDGMEYHQTPAVSKNRARERVRNCTMWKEASPKLLSLAAKQMTPDMPFVIQAGDFVQGDCDTVQLMEKMLSDGFQKVKSYFPDHKLFPVRGNHDVRMKKGNNGTPAIKAFFPLIAKELGAAKIDGSYAVRHGEDLYIFYDGFLRKNESLKSLKKILAENPKSRYTFFISHLPVLTCSIGSPAWLVKDLKAVHQLLLERNAIIITAHTHVPSLVQVKRDGKQLTQVVISSVGKDWKPAEPPTVAISGFDNFCKAIGNKRLNRRNIKAAIDEMKTFEIPVFESYKNAVGFAVLKVSDSGVEIEYHTNGQGKPALSRKLR